MSKYQEMEQSHWVCYQFPDKSYYYGQVGYLDESGMVQSKDNADAANNPKNRLVKHGFGVYLYNVKPDSQPAKYEGYWDRDRKQGQGKLTIPGEFVYEGGFKQGAYHETGRMEWNNGDSYDGNWKKNRMEGGGIFKHHEGFVLKGSFKANYYVDDNILRNPQMSQKEYTLFKKQRKEVVKQKQRNQKIKSGFIIKLKRDEPQKIIQAIVKSNKNNRVPLIISSESAKFNLNSLQTQLQGSNKKCSTFDLRQAFVLKGEQKYNYKQQFCQKTRNTLKEGGALVISLDESECQFKNAFYPDLKQFYDSNGFNSNTWSRQVMKRKQVYERLGLGSPPSQDYVICVWSKVKLEEEMNQERVREKLQLRFQSILPFIKIDAIFVIA